MPYIIEPRGGPMTRPNPIVASRYPKYSSLFSAKFEPTIENVVVTTMASPTPYINLVTHANPKNVFHSVYSIYFREPRPKLDVDIIMKPIIREFFLPTFWMVLPIIGDVRTPAISKHDIQIETIVVEICYS